jgi:hypothetical protein
LVTWVQQQPEQQLFDLQAVAVAGHQGSAPVTCAVGTAAALIWDAGVHLLKRFALVAGMHTSEGAAACSLAADLTQQLDQSGEACSRNCRCTVRSCCGRLECHACTSKASS